MGGLTVLLVLAGLVEAGWGAPELVSLLTALTHIILVSIMEEKHSRPKHLFECMPPWTTVSVY